MNNQMKRLAPRQLGLIIGLIVLSTALFVLGISLERQLETNENSNTHVESEAGETDSEESEESLVAASHLILAIISFMNLRRQDSLPVSA
jgi:hypothetical protein